MPAVAAEDAADAASQAVALALAQRSPDPLPRVRSWNTIRPPAQGARDRARRR